MDIIPTNQWLKKYLKEKPHERHDNLDLQRELICENLTPDFKGFSSYEIHEYLLHHGLFIPNPKDAEVIKKIIKQDFWKWALEDLLHLKEEWNGPDIKIFIFPADISNQKLKVDFNGKSGLAFHDKLFLFVSPITTKNEFQALLTHEYNHVCRLQHVPDKDPNLLQAMVMEGLAEAAVEERLGKEYLSKWTSIYSLEFALRNWNYIINKNLDVKKSDPLHDDLMYGNNRIPKWLGYNTGFHLVSSFVKERNKTMKELLKVPSKEFLDGSVFSKKEN